MELATSAVAGVERSLGGHRDGALDACLLEGVADRVCEIGVVDGGETDSGHDYYRTVFLQR